MTVKGIGDSRKLTAQEHRRRCKRAHARPRPQHTLFLWGSSGAVTSGAGKKEANKAGRRKCIAPEPREATAPLPPPRPTDPNSRVSNEVEAKEMTVKGIGDSRKLTAPELRLAPAAATRQNE